MGSLGFLEFQRTFWVNLGFCGYLVVSVGLVGSPWFLWVFFGSLGFLEFQRTFWVNFSSFGFLWVSVGSPWVWWHRPLERCLTGVKNVTQRDMCFQVQNDPGNKVY